MSYSKAHLFPAQDQHTARLSKAISHPARIAILRLMAPRESVESGFLCRKLPLSAPTIQQHLNYLAERDIIAIQTRPAKALYKINWERFVGLHDILTHCLGQVRLYKE